jgi:hypothetical protein
VIGGESCGFFEQFAGAGDEKVDFQLAVGSWQLGSSPFE